MRVLSGREIGGLHSKPGLWIRIESVYYRCIFTPCAFWYTLKGDVVSSRGISRGSRTSNLGVVFFGGV